jgi:hypothetical protein
VVWLAVLSIAVVIWSVAGVGSGEAAPFWPLWLLVAGAPLPGVTAGAVAGRLGR